MFVDKYKLTSQNEFLKPKFSAFTKAEPWTKMKSGQYSSGLITVVDEGFDDSFLRSWSWLIKDKPLLLATTAWGDFIYACGREKKFFIVLVDQFRKFALGNSLSAVFDKNVASPDFMLQILRLNEFDKAMKVVGELEYGECYAIEHKSNLLRKKNISIFLDVLGQTGRQL
ncbi:hypothetical protein MACH09_38960 [Vibrio sp. MACH09]|uniref:hypothetical protein n=1 Tax=Vibrio sp. MACH09 TaxID=3025122 RepID=UPI002794411B|nr:hypothetical protein [Vibrio sp. MACH09]GLO63388.1 hypothetical protein MACH09_38960 [Vibrio sp. MACH09]